MLRPRFRAGKGEKGGIGKRNRHELHDSLTNGMPGNLGANAEGFGARGTRPSGIDSLLGQILSTCSSCQKLQTGVSGARRWLSGGPR